MPVEYSWTASNGNKFTNVIEVLEDHTYADDLDMDNIGNTAKGNYTWKNEWYVNKNGTGNKIDYGVDKPNGNDMTIYGKWVSTITYNNNGAGATTANKEVLKGQAISSVSGLPALTSAYTFKGWCATNPTSASHATISGTWVPTGNTTIYAKWVSVITYNNNGAGSKPANKEIVKGQQITAAGLPALSSAYTFKGWCTTNPAIGTIVLQSAWVPTGNITIYAKWTSVITIDLDVRVSGSGGNFGDYTTDYNGQNSYEILKGQKFNPSFRLSTHKFTIIPGKQVINLTCKNEWATGHDGAGARVAVNGTYTPTGNMTIYPIWYATVTFMMWGTMFNGFYKWDKVYSTQTVVRNHTVTLPDTLVGGTFGDRFWTSLEGVPYITNNGENYYSSINNYQPNQEYYVGTYQDKVKVTSNTTWYSYN